MARAFPKRKYHKPAPQLPLAPVAPRGPRDHSYQPVEFKCCVEGCQKQGCYGFGVKLREGKIGVFGCLDHREEAEQEWRRNFHTI